METVITAADAILVVVMAYARLLEACVMVALLAGIFHKGVLTVLSHDGAVATEIMGEFLEEKAVITEDHVIFFVDGQLLLTEILVTGLLDIVTHQTTLVVVITVGDKGCKLMDFANDLSAIQAFFVVLFSTGHRVLVSLFKLRPFVVAVELGEIVGFSLLDAAIIDVTIMNMVIDVLFPIFCLMFMPGKDDVAPTTGMGTGIPGTVGQILGL